MINKLKKLFQDNNIDGYIIPKNDEFFSEYSNPDRLRRISNFSGSSGLALILNNQNHLFVDGRYTLQAKNQSGNKFQIHQIPFVTPKTILSKKQKTLSLGFDPKLFTSRSLNRIIGKQHKLLPIHENLVDKISIDKKHKNTNYFYVLSKKVAGNSPKRKIDKLIKILLKRKIDNIFISAPENVAWLLNLRGKDNPNSPIPNCKIIITNKKEIYFFSKPNEIKNIKKKNFYKNFKFYRLKDLFEVITKLNGKYFCIDYNTCSLFNENIIKSKFIIKDGSDPCYLLKSVKNKIEIKNMKQAHIYDGVALTKFLYWIKKTNIKNLNELKIEKKLENFRKKNKKYLYPSFSTIAGSGPNGAIIHYRANKYSNRKLKKNELLLCDSGGQYKYGTTDVTRTICFNKPSNFIKNIYTRVLKGHIAVATTNLKKIKRGSEIDKRARKSLKDINLDYAHGTGHGVGFFLNVHEGPQAISKYNNVTLKKGMILSNEPGYYKENKFGIRIENLIYISEENNKLQFKNLTLAPVEKDLIDFSLLNKLEKNYLFKYNLEIYSNLSKYLNKKEKIWLQNLI
tara:strand:+ start:756 stop:2456 length:1701 start_codon:yes stop_codon:yes gene_type:complete